MRYLFAILAFAGACSAQTLCNVAIAQPVGYVCPADSSTGVTALGWVKWNSAGTALINGATTDTAGAFVGISDATATGPSTFVLHTTGPVRATFDGATTAGHYFTVSTSNAGQLHDQGISSPNSASLGNVTQTNGSAGSATAFVGLNPGAPVALPTPGTSITLAGTSMYAVCTGTCTVTVPVPVPGAQYCVLNDDNIATVITLSAIGSSARYENTARTAYGTAGTGTFVSGGAIGDSVCLLGRDSTHYLTVTFKGTWTAN